MKKSTVIAVFTALSTLTAFSAAQGEERWPRWYIGVTGGYTYMGDEDISGGTASKLSPGNGFGVGGSIGYLPSSEMPLLNALRFEAEVTYHQNDIDTIHFRNGTSASGNGTYDSTAYMANVFYDLPIAGLNWSPYIGGGAGIASLHISNRNGFNSSSSDNEFAYQGMAGIGYAPDSIPNTQWSIGYRYLGASDAELGDGTKVKYSTSSVEGGVKFRF